MLTNQDGRPHPIAEDPWLLSMPGSREIGRTTSNHRRPAMSRLVVAGHRRSHDWKGRAWALPFVHLSACFGNRPGSKFSAIVQSLSDDQSWGRDPMIQGAICSYAYRSFDVEGIKKLSDETGVSSSSFVYVEVPTELKAAASYDAPVVGTLETDLLYALDYDTNAPGRWMAIYLPDGSSGFVNFDKVELQKPYAGGVCFEKNSDGHWVMVAQVSTSL